MCIFAYSYYRNIMYISDCKLVINININPLKYKEFYT